MLNCLGPLPQAQAADMILPKPGTRVSLSPPMEAITLKGLKVFANDPFKLEFIMDKGDSAPQQEQLNKLIKYFLAGLTTPEQDLWVNLSPYEKDRIIPEAFGQTEMGRDLLAQDYILKQITASLMYPEDEIGKKFWKKIYDEAAKKYGTTNIPVNTFNKVWIVPEKAEVYEGNSPVIPAKAGILNSDSPKEQVAYITDSKLKVMLESDYLASAKNRAMSTGPVPAAPSQSSELGKLALPVERAPASGPPVPISQKNGNEFSKNIIREIILPALEKEINEGKNFAQLRQVYNSLILATWYKNKIKSNIIAKQFVNQNKVEGISFDAQDAQSLNIEKIYQQYLMAFKKGATNLIREEKDPITNQMIPRKYFSGGVTVMELDVKEASVKPSGNPNMSSFLVNLASEDPAMSAMDLINGLNDNSQWQNSFNQEKKELVINGNEMAFLDEGDKNYIFVDSQARLVYRVSKDIFAPSEIQKKTEPVRERIMVSLAYKRLYQRGLTTRLFTQGFVGNRHVIVTDWIEGEDLARMIDSDVPVENPDKMTRAIITAFEGAIWGTLEDDRPFYIKDMNFTNLMYGRYLKLSDDRIIFHDLDKVVWAEAPEIAALEFRNWLLDDNVSSRLIKFLGKDNFISIVQYLNGVIEGAIEHNRNEAHIDVRDVRVVNDAVTYVEGPFLQRFEPDDSDRTTTGVFGFHLISSDRHIGLSVVDKIEQDEQPPELVRVDVKGDIAWLRTNSLLPIAMNIYFAKWQSIFGDDMYPEVSSDMTNPEALYILEHRYGFVPKNEDASPNTWFRANPKANNGDKKIELITTDRNVAVHLKVLPESRFNVRFEEVRTPIDDEDAYPFKPVHMGQRLVVKDKNQFQHAMALHPVRIDEAMSVNPIKNGSPKKSFEQLFGALNMKQVVEFMGLKSFNDINEGSVNLKLVENNGDVWVLTFSTPDRGEKKFFLKENPVSKNMLRSEASMLEFIEENGDAPKHLYLGKARAAIKLIQYPAEGDALSTKEPRFTTQEDAMSFIEEFGKVMGKMHRKGFIDEYLKDADIYAFKRDGQWRFHLIDFDVWAKRPEMISTYKNLMYRFISTKVLSRADFWKKGKLGAITEDPFLREDMQTVYEKGYQRGMNGDPAQISEDITRQGGIDLTTMNSDVKTKQGQDASRFEFDDSGIIIGNGLRFTIQQTAPVNLQDWLLNPSSLN